MKYLLIIVSLIAFLIIAGCVFQNNNPPVPPTPQIVYVTVFVTPTQTIPIQNPSKDIENIKTVTVDGHSLSFEIKKISINTNPHTATAGSTINVIVKNVGSTATNVICYSDFTDYGGVEERSITGEPTGLLYPDDSNNLQIRDGGFISHSISQYTALTTHKSSLKLNCLDTNNMLRFEPTWSINPNDIILEL